MWYRRYAIIFLISFTAFLIAGCSSNLSSLLSESLSENYALASYGVDASLPELNDGDIKTWGITNPPKRIYALTFPEVKKIDRIVVYTGNVVGYKLFCWNVDAKRWDMEDKVESLKGAQKVYSGQRQFQVPRFVHRIKYTTDKIKLQVTKASSDGVITTRTPGKDAKILNHRVDYFGTGRRRARIDLYDVFKQGSATIREIEAYSYVERPKTESESD